MAGNELESIDMRQFAIVQLLEKQLQIPSNTSDRQIQVLRGLKEALITYSGVLARLPFVDTENCAEEIGLLEKWRRLEVETDHHDSIYLLVPEQFGQQFGRDPRYLLSTIKAFQKEVPFGVSTLTGVAQVDDRTLVNSFGTKTKQGTGLPFDPIPPYFRAEGERPTSLLGLAYDMRAVARSLTAFRSHTQK